MSAIIARVCLVLLLIMFQLAAGGLGLLFTSLGYAAWCSALYKTSLAFFAVVALCVAAMLVGGNYFADRWRSLR